MQQLVERVLREYLNVSFQPGASGPMVHCPWHDDDKPSCHIVLSTTDARAVCYACNSDRSFIDYVAAVRRSNPTTVKQELERSYGYETGRILDASIVEKYHAAIWKCPAYGELGARGVSDTTIKRFRIGFNAGRLTIPIPNRFGLFVNIRRYLPGADGSQKMRNQRGYGKTPRLYPIDQLRYDKILLCGGEVKALAALQRLNAHGIGCITSTAGETKWYAEYNEEFRGKEVFVCFDIDLAGKRATEQVCNTLAMYAKQVRAIKLPLDAQEYPKGDLNDYVVSIGGDDDGKALLELVETATRWVPTYTREHVDNRIYDVQLGEAVHARFTSKRVRVKSLVSAVREAPYSIPRTVRVTCDRSLPICALCAIQRTPPNEEQIAEVSAESKQVLGLIDTTEAKQTDALKTACGIPLKCDIATFETLESHHVEECRVSPELDLESSAAEREMLPAMFVGDAVELNETYELTARVHPHPKTQTTTLVVNAFKPVQDTLTQYHDAKLEELEIFRPDAWTHEAIDAKLEDIYSDFACNVTGIYLRPQLHFAIDLAYHSILNVRMRGITEAGWVQVLVIGDSAQGKTMCANKMRAHYRLGYKVDCKNATVAGLVGGLQKLQDRWFVQWGIIPSHDRRLVILEELKGLPVEMISKLTEIRSSGLAQIPKIENRKKLARTRLVALSNPRDNRRLSDRGLGVLAVPHLIGALEDVRRFDLAVGISARDIDAGRINTYQIDEPTYEHKYTSELSHRLVLYAWTRDTMQLLDERHLIQTAISLAQDLGSSRIPLIDAGSIKWKLLRLAASLAARTFSTTDDYKTLIIRPAHVEYMTRWLRMNYASDALGYEKYVQSDAESLTDTERVRQTVLNLPHAEMYASLTLSASVFDHEDFMDWCGFGLDQAREMTSFLIRHRAVQKRGRKYVNTPPYVQLLKEMIEADAWVDLSHVEPGEM